MATKGHQNLYKLLTHDNKGFTAIAEAADMPADMTQKIHGNIKCQQRIHSRSIYSRLIATIIIVINNNRIQRRYSRFFTISSQRREPSPTCVLKLPGHNQVQTTCNTQSAHHVQVTCSVPPGTKGQFSH